ncbi:MAG TPA: ParB/RepB/Spo0J family partition protein [Rhodanobacteraceae bacterium]|jgi:ParB family chromosome partitioning protein|nr:ParB/RepB/Spo0J family partition protein [Rhodanobacteraceae bacterium]
MSAKRRGLGSRDLDVLLGGRDTEAAETGGEELRTLPVTQIAPGKYQPRQHMDEARLEELAASIKAQGLIQPVVVRALGRDKFELIAGERRWRAAQKAGLTEVPAVIRDVAPQAVLAMALIENIQREELSALEEAQALHRLIEEFNLTQQQAADAVGRSRAAVTNLLRLLELPEAIRRLLENGRIEMGHARALGTLPAPRAIALAEKAAAEQWSVRELEDAVRLAQLAPSSKKRTPHADPDIVALERELSEKLGARVQIAHGRSGRGKLTIRYHSADELEGVLAKLR